MTEEKKLNAEQKEAVEYGGGPLLIIAGAGTGKTTVITERIKHLIVEKKVSPTNVLALTFTEKAAKEMQERVDVALPLGYANMWISTFHSFGDRILKNEIVNLGLTSRYSLLSEAEAVAFMKKHLAEFELDYFRPLGNPNKYLSDILKHFSRLKDENVSPTDYSKWVTVQNSKLKVQNQTLELKTDNDGDTEDFEKYQELAKAYEKYEELKNKQGLLDYGDLIYLVIKLFKTRPSVLTKYKKQFTHLLVDEFQDTNFAQYELVKLLAPPGGETNLSIVADDNQCLPGNSKISLQSGKKRIDQIKVGDTVVTAVGKGYTSLSTVSKVFSNHSKAKLITFTLESGKKIASTNNHKMFCYTETINTDKKWHYVYLMKQSNLGWRLGVTNDLAARIRLESHADSITPVAALDTDIEARYYEAYFSAKYGIPTVTFTPRPGQALQTNEIIKLFSNLNTQIGAERLAKDIGIELDSALVYRGGVTRGVTKRVCINFSMCHRNYRSKYSRDGYLVSPQVLHLVSIETSSDKEISELRKYGAKLYKAKKGFIARRYFASLQEAWDYCLLLKKITGGIIVKKASLGTNNVKDKPSVIVPASQIFPGSFLPVLSGKKVVYERIVKRVDRIKEITTYDIEVERTHNFVANGVVVHNSIYKFRGASVSNILDYNHDYPKAKSLVLNKNYRSSQTILDHAYQLIKFNDPDTLEAKLGISKKLEKQREVAEIDPEFYFFNRVEDEAGFVANEIGKATNNGQTTYNYKDFAILVRANNHADPFVMALARAGIPYQFLGPGRLFKQPEIKELLAYIKLLVDHSDSVAAFKILSLKHFDISGRSLIELNRQANHEHLSLIEVCEGVDQLPIPEKDQKTISNFIDMYHRHSDLSKTETAGEILYHYLEDMDMVAEIVKDADSKRSQNINKLFDKVKAFESNHENKTIYDLADYLDLASDLGESPLASEDDWVGNDAVNIITVHSAKGLEFPVVFMVNLVNARFPSTEKSDKIPLPDGLIKERLPEGDFHLQEERRLFYVGMTRAEDRLYLLGSKYYNEEAKREKKPSPFVVEALGTDRLQTTDYGLPQISKQLSFLDFKQPSIVHRTPDTVHQTINSLSSSQIADFILCPLKYYYKSILKIPLPQPPAGIFGSVIHDTLHDFYDLAIKGESVSEKIIKQLYEDNWQTGGYESKQQRTSYYQQGIKYLTDYFNQSYHPKHLPVLMEQTFGVKVVENLKLTGRVDRIDLTDNGIEIIDYKTGKPKDTKDLKKDFQLDLYALAVSLGGLRQPGILDKAYRPEEITVSYYYFDNQQKISFVKTQEDLEVAKQLVVDTAKEIEKTDWQATSGMHCDYCEFKTLCDYWK